MDPYARESYGMGGIAIRLVPSSVLKDFKCFKPIQARGSLGTPKGFCP